MTEEQRTYISNWIARNIHVKEERWLERTIFFSTDIDCFWEIDENSYQMKKYLHNNLDSDNMSSEEKALCAEAASLCSYIDELCGFLLYATPEDWEPPEENIRFT